MIMYRGLPIYKQHFSGAQEGKSNMHNLKILTSV